MASTGRFVVHGLLLIYAAILAYILSGLVFKFYISADVFFDLSFALLFFTLGQCIYELGLKKGVLFLVVTSITGFLAEILGTTTGFPFGNYYYTDFLGPKVFGVPEVVPLVWFVIAYLTFSVARNVFKQNLKNGILLLAPLSAFGAVAWDFMVDPMFSSYGYWVWTGQFLPLPELDGIPITNFVGWFLVVTLMLLIYLILSKRRNELAERQNLFDSQLGYFFLLIDGLVANWSLGNYDVIVVGVFAMLAFLAISYYGGTGY
ncbi:MAG: carotenoid biosynthesis protein, partial [Thaumarchaeota archaeon]|nr:carotenoid biosynthesis protein [Nitrososphaerota archaeon]